MRKKLKYSLWYSEFALVSIFMTLQTFDFLLFAAVSLIKSIWYKKEYHSIEMKTYRSY